MKSLLLFIALAMVPAFALSQDTAEPEPDQRGLAKVTRINGFDIYMFSEPVADYEVLDDMGSLLGGLSAFTDTNANITDIVQGFAEKATRKNKKRKKDGEPEIEALIIYNNEKASGIRYTDGK